ncbi:MAG: hypothetical protein JWM78_681 [Verrucomicrobiaceae bacterium]|nr:hypothetical protein [Verrucomicrobiaceae bacterium]
MRSVEVEFDVTSLGPFTQPQHVSGTLLAPDEVTAGQPVELLFCLAGGGYTRTYYHPNFPGKADYSFAEYFTKKGYFVLAVDHLGMGKSSKPDPESQMSRAIAAAANEHALQQTLAGLRAGQWLGLSPIADITVTGFGHSMGGMMAITQQGKFHSFDRLVVMGWTNIGLQLLDVDPADLAEATKVSGYLSSPRAGMRTFFYTPDVPQDVIELDEAAGTFSPACMGRDALVPEIVAAEARATTSPVFLIYSEIDVSPEPLREATYFTAANDVTVLTLPNTAHIHNFAPIRFTLWNRLDSWMRSLPIRQA